MAGTVLGRVNWSATRSDDGYRDYNITFLVEMNNVNDGPQTVSFAAGLPAVGTIWQIGSDADNGAFCSPYLRMTPITLNEPGFFWLVDCLFTSRPSEDCSADAYSSPLLIPDKVSGSFLTRDVQVTRDRNGNLIRNTAKETIKVTEPKGFPTVRITQNRASADLALITGQMNDVNDSALWGLAARTIKLSNVSWERLQFGACVDFYTRTLEFEIDFGTWDRSDIPNSSKKMIRGSWAADGASYTADSGVTVTNAFDYVAAKDYRGNNVINFLNKTTGAPSTTETYLDTTEIRSQSNFLLLGIPTSL